MKKLNFNPQSKILSGRYLIIIGVILFILLVDSLGFLNALELKAIDFRFNIRGRLSPLLDKKARTLSNEIAIIGIDDESILNIKEPFILWDTLFAKIIERLGESRARVIGLDLIWAKNIDEFVDRSEEEKNALKRALLISKNKYNTHIVMGMGGEKEKFQMKGKGNSEIDSSVPMKEFGLIVGSNSFGVINWTFDPDMFIRRVKTGFHDENGDLFMGFDLLVSNRFLNNEIVLPYDKPLINYSSNKDYPIYSFYRVLRKALDSDTEYFINKFRDKIVLFGITNLSEDRYPTPISKETYGILIHAHAINMFLSGEYIKTIGEEYKWYIVFIISSLLGWASFCLRPTFGFAITMVSLIVYILGSVAFFIYDILIPMTTPVISIILIPVLVYNYRFVIEEYEKRRLAKFFESYVNKQVVEDILRSGKDLSLGGKRKRVSLLFSDIRGFTSYSESRPPEEVVKTLNEYLEAMTEAILQNNGTLDKFTGDGLMAFFGDPVTTGNPTFQAVKAALAMRKRLHDLNEQWHLTGGTKLENGIGLHTGEALIGNVGSHKKMDYTAIGDSVNLASRIEGLTKTLDAPILLSEDSFNEVKDLIYAEYKGNAQIRGRANISVYKLVGIKERDEG